MKLSQRYENFLKAVYDLKLDDFSSKDLCSRTAGLAVKEPGNLALHQTLVGVLGADYEQAHVTRLLGTLSCKTFGQYVLAPVHQKGVWRWCVVTVEMLRTAALASADLWTAAGIRAEAAKWRCHANDVARLVALDKAARKAEREAVAAEASLDMPVRRVKPGPGGSPIPDLDFVHTYREPTGPYLREAQEKAFKERERANLDAQHPGRPPPGKKMNQWTPEELAAEKRYHQRNNPAGGTPGFGSSPGINSVRMNNRFDPLGDENTNGY